MGNVIKVATISLLLATTAAFAEDSNLSAEETAYLDSLETTDALVIGDSSNVLGGTIVNGQTNHYAAEETWQDTSHTENVNTINTSIITQDNTNTNHQTIETNQAAPATVTNLTTSGQDTCFGSVTGGLSVAGASLSSGKTYVDENCIALKQAKLLTSIGLKDAAILLLANYDEDIANAIRVAYPTLADHLDLD